MNYNKVLYQKIVNLGKTIFTDSGFIIRDQVEIDDIKKTKIFLEQASSLSNNWDGKVNLHVNLASALADLLTEKLFFSEEEKKLTKFQVLTHDIGKLITHDLVDSERVGNKLLQDIGFPDFLVNINFGWDYYKSQLFSPFLRSPRDRVVLLSDLFGKPNKSGNRLRPEIDVIKSVASLKDRHNDNDNNEICSHIDVVTKNCVLAFYKCKQWVNDMEIDLTLLLSKVDIKRLHGVKGLV